MFVLKSNAFQDGERMLAKYANSGVADGQNISPPLQWEAAPEGTKSFAIAMVDHHPDVHEFVHWLVIDIASDVSAIPEGASSAKMMPEGAKEPSTPYRTEGYYFGPMPPAGTGDHPYEITIYALNVEQLDLPETEETTLDDFKQAIEGKVLGKASLTSPFSQ